MFCPECGVEYREGFSQCSDCQVALVESLPDEPEPDHSGQGWETIEYSTYSADQVPVLKSVLDAEGIEYFLSDENIDTLYGSLPLLRAPRLTVRQEQADQVRQIISDLGEAAPTQPNEEEK